MENNNNNYTNNAPDHQGQNATNGNQSGKTAGNQAGNEAGRGGRGGSNRGRGGRGGYNRRRKRRRDDDQGLMSCPPQIVPQLTGDLVGERTTVPGGGPQQNVWMPQSHGFTATGSTSISVSSADIAQHVIDELDRRMPGPGVITGRITKTDAHAFSQTMRTSGIEVRKNLESMSFAPRVKLPPKGKVIVAESDEEEADAQPPAKRKTDTELVKAEPDW